MAALKEIYIDWKITNAGDELRKCLLRHSKHQITYTLCSSVKAKKVNIFAWSTKRGPGYILIDHNLLWGTYKKIL